MNELKEVKLEGRLADAGPLTEGSERYIILLGGMKDAAIDNELVYDIQKRNAKVRVTITMLEEKPRFVQVMDIVKGADK